MVARAWLPSQVKSRGREETMERRRVSQRAALKHPASQDKVKTLVFIPIKAKLKPFELLRISICQVEGQIVVECRK